jgi:hypothetical protein
MLTNEPIINDLQPLARTRDRGTARENLATGVARGERAIFMRPGIFSLYFRLRNRGSIDPSAAADVGARGGRDEGRLTGELGVESAVLRGVGVRVMTSPCCGIYAWLHLAYTQQRNSATRHKKVKTR